MFCSCFLFSAQWFGEVVNAAVAFLEVLQKVLCSDNKPAEHLEYINKLNKWIILLKSVGQPTYIKLSPHGWAMPTQGLHGEEAVTAMHPTVQGLLGLLDQKLRCLQNLNSLGRFSCRVFQLQYPLIVVGSTLIPPWKMEEEAWIETQSW